MNEDILRKIKRCMELSKSSNENEAAIAIKQMKRLMDHHNVTAQHVMAADVAEHGSKLDVWERPAHWVLALHSAIGQALDCQCIVRSGGRDKASLVFIGVGASAEIAGYAFEVLYRKLKKDRQDFIRTKLSRHKQANKTKLADAFCDGWVMNVYAKVKNLSPNEEAAEKIKAYTQTKLKSFTGEEFESKTRYDSSASSTQAAMQIGYSSSADVDLFVATGATERTLIEGGL